METSTTISKNNKSLKQLKQPNGWTHKASCIADANKLLNTIISTLEIVCHREHNGLKD